MSIYVQRNYRVEFPAFSLDEAICFADGDGAKYFAKEFAQQDKCLVLVWSFAAAMYVARYDFRPLSQ